MTKEYYTEEDLETDLEWLSDHGVNEEEARDFIQSLLKKEWREK